MRRGKTTRRGRAMMVNGFVDGARSLSSEGEPRGARRPADARSKCAVGIGCAGLCGFGTRAFARAAARTRTRPSVSCVPLEVLRCMPRSGAWGSRSMRDSRACGRHTMSSRCQRVVVHAAWRGMRLSASGVTKTRARSWPNVAKAYARISCGGEKLLDGGRHSRYYIRRAREF